MKTCLILIALAVLCLTVQANPTGYGGSGYGTSPRIEVVRPTVHMDTYAAPAAAPAPIHMDTYASVAPAAAPTPVHMDTYASVAPAVAPAPVHMDTYGTVAPAAAPIMQDTTVEIRTPVAIEELDPSLKNLCLQKQNGIVFYLPHPTKQSFYIQCDQFGQAFLKECPAGTIFTQNLVCENINDLHPIATPVVATRPVLDQTVGSYGNAPTFAADTTNVIETTNVETFREAPEFNSLCTSHTIFYFSHPTDRNLFIQCDDFGKAFLKQCPTGLVFTANLACEDPANLLHPTPVAASMDTPAIVSTAYGTVPHVHQDVVVGHTEIFQEAPEFKELCMTKNTYGAQVSTVFYVPHPTKQSFYIQCDQFGRSFLKECPAGTIFTLNLACENVNDLHAIEKETVPVRPQLDQTVGTYGTAPVFAAEASSITQSSVEIVQEAPEFKELCLSKNAYGAQVSTVFYVQHPTNRNMYIQCDQFGRAFLKSCPIGTVFTVRMTCEHDIGEVVSPFQEAAAPLQIVEERPIVHEQVIPLTSYSQNIPVMTQVVERPIMREQVTSYQQTVPVLQAPVVQRPLVQRPIMREVVRPAY